MEVSLHLTRSKYGKFHDLGDYYEDLKEYYFYDDPKFNCVSIDWSRWPKNVTPGISIGRYHPDKALITISPILDTKKVPKYFISHVIYHEMLHHILPWEETENGYSILHTPAFREAESRYKHHAKALKWEENNMDKLIRSYSRKQRST